MNYSYLIIFIHELLKFLQEFNDLSIPFSISIALIKMIVALSAGNEKVQSKVYLGERLNQITHSLRNHKERQ